jgi:hypothetical protein
MKMKAVLMLWHAFQFLGLTFFPFFARWPPLLFLVIFFLINKLSYTLLAMYLAFY